MSHRIHFSVPLLVVAIILVSMYWLYNNANTDTSQDTTPAYSAGMMSSVNWSNLGKKKVE